MFSQKIKKYFKHSPRQFPWRYHSDPYAIMVSEIMLQQTQTSRVIEKFVQFMKLFPTIEKLASADSSKVIIAWQGLGYNRRCINLHKAAQAIVTKFQGIIPSSSEALQTLPGIGPATAGAICVYAFNQPIPFIETNIRTVFINHFFKDQKVVSDHELVPLIMKTMDFTDPRSWFYALTDYGVMLKKTIGNVSQKSKTYTKQSIFSGSNRQLRGQIVKLLTQQPYSIKQLQQSLSTWDPIQIKNACLSLAKDGLVKISKNVVQL